MSSEKVVREKPIPVAKLEEIKELVGKIGKFRTVLLASCKGLPGLQYHAIKKDLRGKAEVKMTKKTLISRAIEETKKENLQDLKKEIGADITLFFSDLDPFALSGLLSDNQSPSKARAGDIAPENIEIEAGPTELVPGPAISELGAVGLKVSVKDGKLEIMKGAIVAKEGEEINANVASVLGKLDMNPMKVGFLPLAAYDSEDDKVYVGIKINKEETLDELRTLIGKALGFATNVEYPAKETMSYFIAKAFAEEKALANLSGEEKKEETVDENKEVNEEEKPVEEEKSEEKIEEKEDSDLTKEDTKEEA
jgi:large subunit ribosomal protein L10